VTPRVSWAARRPGLARRVRMAGAAVAVAALATLIAIGPPSAGTARAASNSYDQITGIGSTDSAITVNWDQGLLDSSNQPLTDDTTDLAPNADRAAFAAAVAAKETDPCAAAGTGPLCFMYGDFDNLSVTVSQTQDITQQGITVSWTGGEPTFGSPVQGGFLQMMECYGDASTGPDPEDCEYGSPGLALSPNNASSGAVNPYGTAGMREGYLCAPGAVASTTDPPFSEGGDPALYGCDPYEPGDANPPHIQPTGEPAGEFTIPFVPVNDPTSPVYVNASLSAYYSEFNSDEIQEAVTNSAGDGQVQFEALTGVGAPGLGCGEPEADGSARGCWLVIVPRGQYLPNGYQLNANNSASIDGTPLSASNWAQRIQVHLDFAAVPNFCPIGTKETETVGTQIAARAVQSWQIALNTQANCSAVYGYSATTEAASTQALASSSSGIGLAFTTIPIGSEAARDGNPGTTLPPILYAPVAVTALGFGFNINQSNGYVTTPVKLTPQLMAQALTQVYLFDLPDFYPSTNTATISYPGPAWAQANGDNLSTDPQFQALNPEIQPQTKNPVPEAPLLTEDHSALNQSVWEWIQSDKSTADWLDGTTTTGTPTVDPFYVTTTGVPVSQCNDTDSPGCALLNLGKAPAIDSFPRAYICTPAGTSTCGSGNCPNIVVNVSDSAGVPNTVEPRCSLYLLPYSNGYQAAAQSVVSGDSTATADWEPELESPGGTAGWWATVGSEGPAHTFMWTIADTPDLAADGLIDADLCDDDGSNCVGPSTASLTTALDSATKDSAGLLEVNPASPGSGGYPLTDVVYAAVPTDQSATALQNYAALIQYAAGAGQTPGVAPGDLPPGYLPLPTSLKNQADLVAQELLAAGGTPTTASPLPTSAGSSTPTPGSPSAVSQAATASASPSSSAYGLKGPAQELVATTTPRQPVGAIRWTLLAVAIVGAACATGGTVLRSARVPRWLHRLRP
jgi:hypothetical protein